MGALNHARTIRSMLIRYPLVATHYGKALNLIVGFLGVVVGTRAMWQAWKSKWRPGGIGSSRPPIKAAWYHRAFLLVGALFAYYVAYAYFAAAWTQWHR